MKPFLSELVACGLGLIALAPVFPARAAVLTDPPLATGSQALDPTEGERAGRQNVTVRASGAATKETLLAVPGFAVVQSFPGFEGTVKSPVNRIEFSDGRPAITFTINTRAGYGGCAAGPGAKGAYTSGSETAKEGESIYIGDNVNDLVYTMEFTPPVAAAAFTVARTAPTTGPSPVWAASYYGPDGALLERQTAAPTHAPNVAALFGRVAGQGPLIARVVFGRDQPTTSFVLGGAVVFIDDVGFAPAVPEAARAAKAAALRATGGVARPALAATMGAPEGETIDFPAGGASPQGFLQRIPGYGVVQNWAGFTGLARGAREGANTLDFDQGLDFRFHVVATGDGAEGAGAVTTEDAFATSPRDALRVGGAGAARVLEISAGVYDQKTGEFLSDGAVYAAGFVVTNLGAGEVRATFYNRAGDVLSTQTASGMEDPSNAGNPATRRGAEVYFGHIATSPSDESRWVHRVRIEDHGGGHWGLDDFGFATAP